MRCSKAKRLISDYIDNGLKKRQRIRLEKHLHACSDCRKVLEDFREIAKSVKGLEELTPSQKTWLRIRERLKPEEQRVLTLHPQKRPWFGYLFFPPKLKYALSAALLLVFVVSAVTIGLKYNAWTGILGKKDPMQYTLAKLDEAERHYKKAIKALWEAVSAQEGNFNKQVAEVFRKNLKIIDSSIIACREIVLQEPENIDARNFLMAAYRKKVDFLQEMMEIGRPPSPKKEIRKVI
ncbi:MAG: zf-HC2 domain-containing protein [Candidatus Aminicenantes bacterium]|nr:MAG: zf-HC2 domain-containing protein [Candidatus Aminicenantes bacterium]